jgi:hypothetical protein
MCYHVDSEVPADKALEFTPLNLSPYSRTNYLQEKVDRLQARQVNLEATEAELEHQR